MFQGWRGIDVLYLCFTHHFLEGLGLCAAPGAFTIYQGGWETAFRATIAKAAKLQSA